MISVGIDVSKGKSTVCIMRHGGEILAAPFEMLHNIESIIALERRLKDYDEEVRVVLETTGHYHWPIVSLLVENGIFVACVNALRMKKYCAQSIRRVKTDQIDSIKIASYGIAYWHELSAAIPANNTYDELRTCSRQYYQYISLSVKAKINLSNLLDQTMPGIQNLLADQHGNHKLTNFVQRYWHFNNILSMGNFEFVSDYCSWAKKQGYRMNEHKAEEIYTLAQNSISVLPNMISTKMLIIEAVRVLQEIDKSSNAILAYMQQLASTLPEYSVVLAMGGTGDVLAPRVIAEIGDIHRFHSKSALIAYAGIDAPPYQSGSFNATQRHISKRGNKYLRKTSYEIMQAVMRTKPSSDDAVYLFILKKQGEGKNNKSAKIAGLNKFLKIYYARVYETYSEIENQFNLESAT